MALNIKNRETEKLAHELAELTGETLTGAVTEVLRERLERNRAEHGREGVAERLLDLARDFRASLTPEELQALQALDVDGLLYDEGTGLPR